VCLRFIWHPNNSTSLTWKGMASCSCKTNQWSAWLTTRPCVTFRCTSEGCRKCSIRGWCFFNAVGACSLLKPDWPGATATLFAWWARKSAAKMCQPTPPCAIVDFGTVTSDQVDPLNGMWTLLDNDTEVVGKSDSSNGQLWVHCYHLVPHFWSQSVPASTSAIVASASHPKASLQLPPKSIRKP